MNKYLARFSGNSDANASVILKNVEEKIFFIGTNGDFHQIQLSNHTAVYEQVSDSFGFSDENQEWKFCLYF